MPARSTVAGTGLAGLVALILVAALWWLFAPTKLGGDFAYVTVSGNSMSPLLDTGDLVLLRSGSDYEVGDVVAYRHPEIGTVLHRIVAEDGQRFTLRGDNRTGEDTYQPLTSDIIGREWAIWPNGGRVVSELQRPRNLALLVGATVLLGLGGASSARRSRRRAQPSAVERPPRRDISIFSPTGRQLSVAGLALGVGSIALLGLLVANGTTRAGSTAVPFSEKGAFSYGGPIEGGVYDDDLLAAPEPLYRQLVDELPVEFSYSLRPGTSDAAITEVFGTYVLHAEVGAEDGWTRTYPLHPATTFSAPNFEVTSVLDLTAIETDLAAVSELTGIASSTHVVRVIATVEAAGQIDGLPFKTDYRHRAQFRMSPLELRFDGTPDVLALTESRSVARPTTEASTLSLPMVPVEFRYAHFPLIAAIGLTIAAVLAVIVGRATLRTWRLGEAARIRATYDALLVEVAEERAAFGARSQDVGSFGDLVRLAGAEGLAIMHRSGRDDDEFFVSTADRSWRYAVRKPRSQAVTEFDGRYITTSES